MSAFLLKYPEFSDQDVYSEQWIADKIADASLEIKEEVWGIYYENGLAALTAHMISVRQRSIGGGGVVRGDIASFTGLDGTKVEFSNRWSAKEPDPMKTTLYGQEFLRIQQIVAYKQPRQYISS